jgi:UDP-N-acetyl-D-mannosaminuronate dehydrogenase
VIVGTGHEEFKKMDLAHIASLMNARPAMVDGRNVFEPRDAKKQGFAFRGVGRTTFD